MFLKVRERRQLLTEPSYCVCEIQVMGGLFHLHNVIIVCD
jgi:hypothetical protein